MDQSLQVKLATKAGHEIAHDLRMSFAVEGSEGQIGSSSLKRVVENA